MFYKGVKVNHDVSKWMDWREIELQIQLNWMANNVMGLWLLVAEGFTLYSTSTVKTIQSKVIWRDDIVLNSI